MLIDASGQNVLLSRKHSTVYSLKNRLYDVPMHAKRIMLRNRMIFDELLQHRRPRGELNRFGASGSVGICKFSAPFSTG